VLMNATPHLFLRRTKTCRIQIPKTAICAILADERCLRSMFSIVR
jgi:hypothetical protein